MKKGASAFFLATPFAFRPRLRSPEEVTRASIHSCRAWPKDIDAKGACLFLLPLLFTARSRSKIRQARWARWGLPFIHSRSTFGKVVDAGPESILISRFSTGKKRRRRRASWGKAGKKAEPN